GVTNPYFSLNENGSDFEKERVYGSLDLKYELNDWSKMTYRFGLDQNVSKTRQWDAIVQPEPGSPNYDSSTEQDGFYGEILSMDKQLNHDLLFDVDLFLNDDLQLQTTTGFNINSRTNSNLAVSVGSQTLPGF